MVGAAIAGMSAAIESARLGREVVLVDGLPALGGQMVNSSIGLFAGVFGNAPEYEQLTHGIFNDIFRDLGEAGSLYFDRRQTMTVHYDEVALGRWLENAIRELGVKVVLGARARPGSASRWATRRARPRISRSTAAWRVAMST